LITILNGFTGINYFTEKKQTKTEVRAGRNIVAKQKRVEEGEEKDSIIEKHHWKKIKKELITRL